MRGEARGRRASSHALCLMPHASSLLCRSVSRLPILLDVAEEADEVVSVLFLYGEDSLEDAAGRDVVIADVTDHFRVRVDGDALGDEILFDHVDQRLPFD